MILPVLIAAMAAAAPAGTASHVFGQTISASSADVVVCRRASTTASPIPTRTCRLQSEWKAMSVAAQRDLRSAARQPVRSTHGD